jgi:hypothetical protein
METRNAPRMPAIFPSPRYAAKSTLGDSGDPEGLRVATYDQCR